MYTRKLQGNTFCLERSSTSPVYLTSVCAEVHLAVQDVKTASYGFQHTVRDSVHDDVTVPRYVFLSEWRLRCKMKKVERQHGGIGGQKSSCTSKMLRFRKALTCGFLQQTGLSLSFSGTSLAGECHSPAKADSNHTHHCLLHSVNSMAAYTAIIWASRAFFFFFFVKLTHG